jgi:uncharacterized protein (TIGR02246 family)
MAELQKKGVRDLNTWFNKHDAKAVAALYAPDGVFAVPEAEGWDEKKGREAIEADHAKLFGEVPDAKQQMARVFLKGDVAVVEWVGYGTGKDGKKAGFRAASVLWFDDAGLIKQDHEYLDEVTIGTQMGHIPGKARPMPSIPIGEPTWVVATDSPEEAKLAEVAKKNWPASWPQDEKAYAETFTDDALHEEIASTNDYAGKKALMAEAKMWRTAAPDAQISVDNLWAIGEHAIIEFTFKGTQKGPIGKIKATGKTFSIHGLDVDLFKGDKYAKATTYSNGRELLGQLGVMPQPKTDKAKAAGEPKEKGKPPADKSKPK